MTTRRKPAAGANVKDNVVTPYFARQGQRALAGLLAFLVVDGPARKKLARPKNGEQAEYDDGEPMMAKKRMHVSAPLWTFSPLTGLAGQRTRGRRGVPVVSLRRLRRLRPPRD